MKIASAYSVRLRNFCRVFDDTVEVYRKAVDFFIEIMLRHRDPKFTELKHDNDCIRLAEGLNVVNKDIAVKTANFIVKLANEFKVDASSWSTAILRVENGAPSGNGCITGGPSMSRRWWSTRRIGAAFAFVASAPGTRRSLPTTARVLSQETRRTTACVRSRQGSAMSVICRLRTISDLATSFGSTRSPFRQRNGDAFRQKFRSAPIGSLAP